MSSTSRAKLITINLASKGSRYITSDFLLNNIVEYARATIVAAIDASTMFISRLPKQPNTVNTAITNAAKSYEMLLLL